MPEGCKSAYVVEPANPRKVFKRKDNTNFANIQTDERKRPGRSSSQTQPGQSYKKYSKL